ncbi:hypothetical protein PIB30_034785 [Stylosanthes scabra]|uniref:Uncharacterized protein n=1 Tax=Stylosanthes scabra TaxID=79078 RepID=A0ABU6SEF1_9FABA|nr:hypothetical protein [Stylosanthes scabra]
MGHDHHAQSYLETCMVSSSLSVSSKSEGDTIFPFRISLKAPILLKSMFGYKGTDAVEGIAVDVSKIRELQLSPDIFKKMPNIRLLKLYAPLNERSCNVHLPIGLESFSHKLRCLEWNGYPSMTLPVETFCPENLVMLCMPHSRVKKLWDGAQDLVNLKEIDLYGSRQLMELPDLSKASKLEILNVSHCVNLYHVHPSIMSLSKIVDLILYGCKNLKTLHARAIKNLFVNGCLNLKEFSLAS